MMALKVENRSLGPKEISAITGLNHSTVRVYLRDLVKEGVIGWPFRGNYVTIPTPEVGEDPPRVHDLVLHFDAPGLAKGLETCVERYGDVKVEVRFGGKRGKITGFLSCDAGLDYRGCILAVEKFKDLVRVHTGLEVLDQDIKVRNCHLNQDFQDIRLDGLTCVTVTSFLGSLERIYNKGSGVRSEVQVKPDSLESIYVLLKGGVTSYNILQGLFMLTKRQEEHTLAVKFLNKGIQHIVGLLEKLLERIDGLR